MKLPALDQTEKVAQAFESPGWYLRRFAVNIQVRVETIMEMVRVAPATRVLDVGCGDGSLSLPLLQRGAHITFLDRSQTMLDIVGSRIPEENGAQARMLKTDFFDSELEPHNFDVIICVGVLAYVPDLDVFLKRVKELLAPGGTLLLELTNTSHFFSWVSRAYGGITGLLKKPRFITVKRSKNDVVTAVTSAGFDRRGLFEYTFWLPIVSRLLTQDGSYRLVRSLFGWYPLNRNSFLGNECIMSLSLKD